MITTIYNNTFLNIRFTCPDGWTLFSHQQGNIKKMQQDIYQKFDEELPKQHLQSLCVLNLVKYKPDNPLVAELQLQVSMYKMDKPYLYDPDTDSFEVLTAKEVYIPVYLGDRWYLRWRVNGKSSHNYRLYPFGDDYYYYFKASNFTPKFKKELWITNALVVDAIYDAISEAASAKIVAQDKDIHGYE